MKHKAITLLKLGLSLAILVFLYQKAAKDDQLHNFVIAEKNWLWLGLAVAACAGAHLISYVRWRMLVRALGLPFSILDAIRIGLIGTCFNVVAFGVVGGDSLRAFYAAREMKNKTPEAIASVLVDRLIGLLTMFGVAATTFLCYDFSAFDVTYPEKIQQIRYVCMFALAASIGGLTGFMTLLFFPNLENRFWFNWISRLPKIGDLLKRLTQEIRVYRGQPLVLLLAFVMSVGVNVCFAVSIFLIASGISNSHPTFAQHFLIEPISMVSNAVPLPGGIGGMELALDFLYQGFTEKDSSSQGVVVAFCFRATLLLVSAAGAVVWFFNRSKIAELQKEPALDTSKRR